MDWSVERTFLRSVVKVEAFIERDDAPIAEFVPPERAQGVTGAELAGARHAAPRPDEGFADGLEAIHASRGGVPALR